MFWEKSHVFLCTSGGIIFEKKKNQSGKPLIFISERFILPIVLLKIVIVPPTELDHQLNPHYALHLINLMDLMMDHNKFVRPKTFNLSSIGVGYPLLAFVTFFCLPFFSISAFVSKSVEENPNYYMFTTAYNPKKTLIVFSVHLCVCVCVFSPFIEKNHQKKSVKHIIT